MTDVAYPAGLHPPARMPVGGLESAGAALFLAIAVVTFGIGLAPANPSTATIAVLAAAALASAALVPAVERLRVTEALLRWVMSAGIIMASSIMAIVPVLPEPGYRALVIGSGLAGAAALHVGDRWRWPLAGSAFIGHLAAMWWMLAAIPAPPVDVILFQHDGAAALLRGEDPYGLRFPNLYYELPVDYYAPELLDGRELDFGFIYPPLSLLLAIPAYLVAGDVRFGTAAALTISGALIATTRPTTTALGAAMLVIFAPATQVVLYGGWTEPFVAMLLAMTVWFGVRHATSTPIWLGLLVAVKQYVAPILFLGLMLIPAILHPRGISRRLALLIPIVIPLATVLPFAIWDLGAVVHSLVGMHLVQPFRVDALSIPAQMSRWGFDPVSSVLGFALGLAALIGAILWLPRTMTGFSVATAGTLLVFFLFNKQAFLHYYVVVLIALACALAAIPSIRDPELRSTSS